MEWSPENLSHLCPVGKARHSLIFTNHFERSFDFLIVWSFFVLCGVFPRIVGGLSQRDSEKCATDGECYFREQTTDEMIRTCDRHRFKLATNEPSASRFEGHGLPRHIRGSDVDALTGTSSMKDAMICQCPKEFESLSNDSSQHPFDLISALNFSRTEN